MRPRLTTKERRQLRTRMKVKETGRLRLSVFRSNKYIYAQIIDDAKNETLVAINPKEVAKQDGKILTAKEVGKMIAAKAKSKKITAVVFDRGSYNYHGRVKALAEGAREGGLQF